MFTKWEKKKWKWFFDQYLRLFGCCLFIYLILIRFIIEMKKIPILTLIKLQLCFLTIVMIFCKVNGIKMSISFYVYYFINLAIAILGSVFCEVQDVEGTQMTRDNVYEHQKTNRKTQKKQFDWQESSGKNDSRSTVKIKKSY